MTNLVDPMRHLSVFNPRDFGERRIDVIGCGAVGSRVGMALAKLGVRVLHLHDFDVVEEHNIANQLFGRQHIGRKKAEALAEMITEYTGLKPVVHTEPVTGRTRLGEVVFMLVDSMAARKEIFEGAIRYKPMTHLMVETRMGTTDFRVYTVQSMRPSEVEMWSKSWYPDEEAVQSVCGSSITVGSTAELTSGLAVWQFLNWFRWTTAGGNQPSVELFFDVGGLFSLNNPPLR